MENDCDCVFAGKEQDNGHYWTSGKLSKEKSGLKWIWDMFGVITSWNVHFGANSAYRRILQLAIFSRFYQNTINLER